MRFLTGTVASGFDGSLPEIAYEIVLGFTLCSTAARTGFWSGAGGLCPFMPERDRIPVTCFPTDGAGFRFCAGGRYPCVVGKRAICSITAAACSASNTSGSNPLMTERVTFRYVIASPTGAGGLYPVMFVSTGLNAANYEAKEQKNV